jgi:hypothetical protein
VQRATMRNKDNGFGKDGAVGFVSAFAGVLGEELGYPLDMGLLYYVPITSSVWTLLWLKVRLYCAWNWIKGFFQGGIRI